LDPIGLHTPLYQLKEIELRRARPLEADGHLDIQEISRLLWNPKVHYHARKNTPLGLILCQLMPINIRRFVLQSPIYDEVYQVVSFYLSFTTKILYLFTEILHKYTLFIQKVFN
jgi:hypothetical protein